MTGGGRYSDVRRALREVRRDTALSGRGAGEGVPRVEGRTKRRGRAVVVATAVSVSAAAAGRNRHSVSLVPRRFSLLSPSIRCSRFPRSTRTTRATRLSRYSPAPGGGRISRLRRPCSPGQLNRGGENRDRVPASGRGLLACSRTRTLFARFSPRKSPTTRSPTLLARLTCLLLPREPLHDGPSATTVRVPP